jgi:ribonuclease P protein component
MLAAAQRLRRSRDFAAAVRRGRRAGRGAVVVHLAHAGAPIGRSAQPGAELSKPVRIAGAEITSTPARAGFVVSKAVGGAVVRNKVRRRLRHLLRERLSTLPSGTTLVVRALPGAAEVPYARLGADLDAAIAAARNPRRPGGRRK